MVIITRDTHENWFMKNPILELDEIGYDTTHNRIKIGNGIYHWNDLPFMDKSYDDSEIRALIDNINNQQLPLKANKDDVYDKAYINNQHFITDRELASKNYLNKDEAAISYLTRHEADYLVTREELNGRCYATKSEVYKKADKADTYTKSEVDKKIAQLEFGHCCHHVDTEFPPCNHPDMPVYGKPSHKDYSCSCDCDCHHVDCDDLFASVYVKGEVDALLGKKADAKFVNSALLTKADISYVDNKLLNEYYSMQEINDIIKSLTGQEIDKFVSQEELEQLENNLNTNYYTKEEVENIINSITGVDISAFATKEEVENISTSVENKADISYVDEELAKKANIEDLVDNVKYKTFEYNGEIRKTIELKNYDSISGLKTDGEGVNLAMVSKWDVADFSSSNVHTNLNTKDNITINDEGIVATIADIEKSIEPKADISYVDENIANLQTIVEDTYSKEVIDAKYNAVNSIAENALRVANDTLYDLTNNYLLKSSQLETDKEIKDSIAQVSAKLDKVIQILMEKGIIEKGELG